ncbi:MAG: hypothetical protein B6245_18055 [Desulfobacteraceae bacterium 4572_88]|nr:MAG: hypothetical protein B6245_18055 [Desulfobacteraceae bacterium 4572_88]
MKDKTLASILIVDDYSKNLQILADILKSRNYKIAMAKDGFKALKFVNRKKPDLILLDIMMPEMDGFEFCHHLKKNNETKEIPIIFISALCEPDDKIRGFQAGGVDYITKPFHKEEVLARVETHLRLKRSQEDLKAAYQKLQRAYDELEVAARTDSLTGLSNRRDIIERMAYEKVKNERSGKPFSLILTDIDDFKRFNDEHGHDCGDFVLVSVANLMRSKVRKQDSVARWGREEFLLLLPETGLRGAKVVADAIHQTLAEQCYEYRHQTLKISMTFGISSFSELEDPEQCIRMADQAMYRGKKSGKNCIILSENKIPT